MQSPSYAYTNIFFQLSFSAAPNPRVVTVLVEETALCNLLSQDLEFV